MNQSPAWRSWWVYFYIITIAGLFKGCTDLEYAISGEEAIATFRDIRTSKTRHGGTIANVRYRFTDSAGKELMGYDGIAPDWQPPADGQLEIVYIPGKMELSGGSAVSRLKSSSGKVGLIMLMVGLGGTLIFGFLAVKTMESSTPG